jgi:hypothetical protein
MEGARLSADVAGGKAPQAERKSGFNACEFGLEGRAVTTPNLEPLSITNNGQAIEIGK